MSKLFRETMSHEMVLNPILQASFIRHGSGKVVMSLSKDDSTQLWDAVEKRTCTQPIPISRDSEAER
jgi:autophagy-related protein 5